MSPGVSIDERESWMACRDANVSAIDLSSGIGQRRPMSEQAPGARIPGEDIELVSAARGGDRVAFEALYHRYVRMVHGILLARVPRAEVEDLVQDVFVLA